ncbi:MAG: IS21 family transposase [Acidobacteria bacterium 37-71-11]|nr:MAG: IS21 family transposase [Acidobacteria bacterium 37-71-11]HQT95538.1 IS21 family transposase [Thermoanaerobaculaceae bacterium]
MRKCKEILRLKWACGLSHRQISRSCGVGHGTVGDTLRRAAAAGLSWASVEGMDEGALERALFAGPAATRETTRPVPAWADVHRELKRKGVTLALLWQEYKEGSTGGLQYSRYCDLYRAWKGRLALSMRQDHRAGEATFVDYCGPTVEVRDGSTGEARRAAIFVAVLGASSYTYVEATWSQGLEDWIGSHVRAFEFFGGVTELVVPDNLRSGVSRACWYEPDLNPTYHEMAQYYQTAILPARPRKPRDKAKVEAAVLLVERWILARLRHRTFFSLSELNAEIVRLVALLNSRPMRVLRVSRRQLYETLDRPALQPLPAERYEYAEWRHARVAIDYHVEVATHYYSVPYQLVGQQVDVRVSAATVECFLRGKRVAAHARSAVRGRHTTVAAHMPRAHQAQAAWTPERVVRWAGQAGPSVAALVAAIMGSRAHPQQGFRPCLGLLRLGTRYGESRLEAACARALAIGGISYRSVKSILEHELDRQPLAVAPTVGPLVVHPNIRGAEYYR